MVRPAMGVVAVEVAAVSTVVKAVGSAAKAGVAGSATVPVVRAERAEVVMTAAWADTEAAIRAAAAIRLNFMLNILVLMSSGPITSR